MEYVERQLESARQSLLDLTMRNRLLNFRPTKRSTIPVVDEIPAEIYEILVLNERVMDFLPKPESKEGEETKSQADLGMYLDLVDTGQLVFHRIFRRDDFGFRTVDFNQRAVQRGGFTGTGWAGDQNDAVWQANQFAEYFVGLLIHAQIAEIKGH